MPSLRQYLLDSDLAFLRVIAAQWGVDLDTNRHEDVVAALAAHLADPAAQQDMWAVLPEPERQALADLAAAGRSLPMGTFTRRYGEIRLMGPGRLERERPWESPAGPAESLWYRGMIARGFDRGPGGMQEVIWLLPGLFAWLDVPSRPDESGPDATRLKPQPFPSASCQAAAWLCDDLCTLLAYIHSAQISPTPGEGFPARHWAALSPQLRDLDPTRFQLLVALAAGIPLIKSGGGALRPEPRAAAGWLQAPSLEQMRVLFQTWMKSTAWNDLWHVPTIRCEETGSWHNDPLAPRQTVLDVARALQPGEWYSVAGLVSAVRATAPDFQRPGGDYGIWYIRDAVTNEYLTGFESWDRVDGALLAFLIRGPLYWLGITALDESSELFSLTEAGAVILGMREAGAAPPEDVSFAVDAEGQVTIGAGRRYDRFQLARVADWESSGDVYGYRITAAALDRARAERILADRVLAFLEKANGAPLPMPVAAAIRRHGERGTEVWAQPAIVLRAAQPELLDQIAESHATRRYILELVSSTVALVARRDWPRMQAALLEMGILAQVSVEPKS